MRNSWNHATESLFSAWIEKLFDAPPDQDLSWKAWHEVLRDRSRNFLFNYLGRGEDNVKTGLRPDCADFVYFLRAYFAYKMGLPFGYSNCSRGIGGKPPKCYQWFDMEHPEVTRPPPPPEQEIASATLAAATPPAPTPTMLDLFGRPQSADAAAPAAAPCGAEAEAEAPDDVRRISAGRRRRRAYRRRARGGERRQHRFLHRPADASSRCARARSTPTPTATC